MMVIKPMEQAYFNFHHFKEGQPMILYKDFENIFRIPEIFEQFLLAKTLFEKSIEDAEYNWRYKNARKKLKLMVDSAK